MSKRGVRLAIVCEDDEHKRFARRVLLYFGFNNRELRFVPVSDGRGAGDQHVIWRYPAEVRALRQKGDENVGLLILIDADDFTVQDRNRALEKALDGDEQARRGADERIVHWIPRRNIETWVAYLNKKQVDEESDYKKQVTDEQFEPASKKFVEWLRQPEQRPHGLLPSINAAFDETVSRGLIQPGDH